MEHVSSLFSGMQPLRPYQAQAVADVYAAWQEARRVLLVAPTGAGKTRLAEEFVSRSSRSGDRVLFIAHRRGSAAPLPGSPCGRDDRSR